MCLPLKTFAWCSAPAVLDCAAEALTAGPLLSLSLLLTQRAPSPVMRQKKSVLGQGGGEGAVSLLAAWPCKQRAAAAYVNEHTCSYFPGLSD